MVLKRKRNGLKFILPFLLLAGMMLHSCTDEGIVDAPAWHQAVEQGDNAIMRAAKTMVEGTQGEMSMPDMVKTLGKSQTRAAGAAPQTLAAGSFTIDWEAAQSLHEEDGTVLLVPIKMKQNMAIWRFTVINNKRKAEQTPMHSVLYVKKFNRTGNIMGRVLSYAPSRQYIKRHPKYKKKIEGYNPDHTDYSGLLLISSLEGTLFHGFNYENGHRQYTFRPNVKAHEHHHETNPITRALTTTDNRIAPIQAPVFNMRLITSASAISTYSFDNETYEQPGCIFCGGDPYTCNCFEVVGDVCDICGKVVENCICECPFCDKLLRECECSNGNCLFCNKPLHECECGDTIGGGGGETGSGTGTGTGPSTGGTPTGGGETPPEDEEPIPAPPCYNSETGIYNPLIYMRLAPPTSWNIAGATFGNTRKYANGNPKPHDGIDLYAEVGTPVYAMADGEVVLIVTTQPNKIDGAYPSEYHGDRNGAGNRIKIKSIINGQIVYFSYWHLQAGNPVGIDRNGNTLKENSHVYAGDIIGYTGITGNADENVPHLHLGIQNSDANWINPTTYLNATVSTTSTTITTPCD